MKIYSMTATFGKLENETLRFDEGLNVIHAPNEWGKSTWCAFLVNMLYGVETRAKSTKNALADKEKYAPWSGSPMSGHIELRWNDRDITIERRTSGRIPLGTFSAYETHSGVTVDELTAENCGLMLLGVERSVFLRSAFLRSSDLGVTDDEQLRRRLNALVTTGDESNAADFLEQKLKELKNKIRANRSTGLLPNAHKEAAQLEEKIARLEALHEQSQQCAQSLQETQASLEQLQNHKIALEFAAAEEVRRSVAQAQTRCDILRESMEKLEKDCAALPDAYAYAEKIDLLQQLHRQSMDIDMQQGMLQQPPQPPAEHPISSAEAAQDLALLGESEKKLSSNKKRMMLYSVSAALMCILALVGILGRVSAASFALLAAAVAVAVLAVLAQKKRREAKAEIDRLRSKHPGVPPEQWRQHAQQAEAASRENLLAWERYTAERDALRQKREALNERMAELTQGKPISECMRQWEAGAQQWQALTDARRSYETAREHSRELALLQKNAPEPRFADTLTHPLPQTEKLLSEAENEIRRLRDLQGNLRGRVEAMGEERMLRQELEAVMARIEKLDAYYAALETALDKLRQASEDLQRRFAPQITKAAQEVFRTLTDGRYDRLSITQELALQACANNESTLQGALYRSEGTIDQMYFALRIAVSRALMPECPLILDDALLRFDDKRHDAAMKLLRKEAETRQIISFTCHER